MAQNRAQVDKAVSDATRGRVAAVRAEGDCARLRCYRAAGLRALEKSSDDVATALAAKHTVTAVAEADDDEAVPVAECVSGEGRALVRFEDHVLMVASEATCILQAEDDGGVFQVHIDSKEERMHWLCGEELQVELRPDITIAHLGRKLHIILESGMERVTVMYDEGPVKQVTLTEDGRAGVRLREEEAENVDPGLTAEQAKARRAEVAALRDTVKEGLSSAKEAAAAAENLQARAKKGRDAVAEKEKAFMAERAKKDGDGPADIVLEGGFLGKVSGKRVELAQLPDSLGSAQLKFGGEGEWTWACSSGDVVSTRGDGVAVVKLSDASGAKTNAKVERIQLMPTGDRLVAFQDGSRFQLMQDGTVSFHRDPVTLMIREGSCSFAGKGVRSKLEDSGDFMQEEDSGLSWALRGDELVVLSAGHSFPDKSTDGKSALLKEKPQKGEKLKEEEDKPKTKAAPKKKPAVDVGKGGLAEDASSQEPLTAANVLGRSLSTSKSKTSITTVTDKDGRFELKREEELVVRVDKVGYAPEWSRIAAQSLAFCLKLWPLALSESFEGAQGVTLDHEEWRLRVRGGAVRKADGSVHSGPARLDLGLPEGEGHRLYVGVADPEKEKDLVLDGEIGISFKTSATLREGAPLPVVWALDADAGRRLLPPIERKSFVFRSVFGLPGVYRELDVCRQIRAEVEMSVRPLLQRAYLGSNPSGNVRLYVPYTARELMICGIVDVLEDTVDPVTPLLLEEAKNEKSLLRSALDKCKIKEVRLETTHEAVVSWKSSGIYVDGVELPCIDDEALVRAHEEVQLLDSLKGVASDLSRASGLLKEVEAVSQLKDQPRSLKDLAAASLSLFTDGKKTAEQLGGWSSFHKKVRQGLLGSCMQLNPYRVSEAVYKRTQKLAKFDEAKLSADYPAAARLAAWLREFVRCGLALHEMGVAVKDKKQGNECERSFLAVGCPVQALMALRANPKKENGVREVEFRAPSPGWWTIDFDSWRAAGGGRVAAKALA